MFKADHGAETFAPLSQLRLRFNIRLKVMFRDIGDMRIGGRAAWFRHLVVGRGVASQFNSKSRTRVMFLGSARIGYGGMV